MEKKEVKVASRNALSKLRVVQFLLVILTISLVIIGATIQERVFYALAIISGCGALTLKGIRWFYRD